MLQKALKLDDQIASMCGKRDGKSEVYFLSLPISSHLDGCVKQTWPMCPGGLGQEAGVAWLRGKRQFALALPCIHCNLDWLPGVSVVKPTKLPSSSSVQLPQTQLPEPMFCLLLTEALSE